MNKIDEAKSKIVKILKQVSAIYGITFGVNKYDLSNVEQHANQIVFELIKETYIDEISENTQSLYKISGGIGNDTELKKNSRTLQNSIYYMDKLDEYHYKKFGVISNTPQNPSMSNLRNRTAGYKITKYGAANIDVLNELKILEHIANKRITSVKKISNTQLNDEFEEYREYFKNIYEHIKNDDEYIMYSCLLLTLEMRYALETVNKLADKMSKYNKCTEKNKFPSNFIEEALVFGTITYYHVNSAYYMRENRLVLMRINFINNLTPDNFADSCQKYNANLEYAFIAKQVVMKDGSIKEMIKKASLSEKRHFIENNYNIWSILDEEPEWGDKKEVYMRNIYKSLVCEITPPKKK